jgi:predicted porin
MCSPIKIKNITLAFRRVASGANFRSHSATYAKLFIAGLGTFSSTAFAQTSLIVYGIIDTGVRYISNADAAGDSKTAMGNGIFQGSRVGFLGQQDLDGGTAAIFHLASGFSPTTGTSGQQGQMFGLWAYAGLKDNTLGEIDAGRQTGLAFRTLANYDPLGTGVANETAWQVGLEGNRFDNTLVYTNSFGPIQAQLQYSFGGQAGSVGIGATTAADIAYTVGPLSIGGVAQQAQDVNGNDATLAGLGAYYVFNAALKLTGSYFDARRDPGFERAANLSGGPLANTSLSSNVGNTLARTDKVWTVGALYNMNPAITLTLASMVDSVKNDTSTGMGGSIATVYGVAEYRFSRRTEVYVDLDRTKLAGGEITSPDSPITNFSGHTGRTGLSLGMRTVF